MLPIPFDNYVPKFFKRDDKLAAFTDKHDELMQSFSDDTLGLNTIFDPVRCPAVMLDYLGQYLNAGIKDYDSEAVKRNKIYYAVYGHKRRCSFNLDAKPKIDLIAGGDSDIYRNLDGDDWIMVGDGETLPDSSYYWASLGCDGIDDDLGIGLIGDGYEVEVAGNIYIDVDNASLTADQVAQIVLELEDIAPSYMRVHLGYILGGLFVEYDIIE